jgi:hydroxymethylglutaryl-CoA reductase (NADPH)
MERTTAHDPAPIVAYDDVSPSAIAERWRRIDRPWSESTIGDARAVARAEFYRRNVENYIGTVEVPVGLVGPLEIYGRYAEGSYHVPLATTEAALVASYARGARLITDAGGCNVAVVEERVSRVPVFTFATLARALAFATWLAESEHVLRDVAERTSRHAKAIEIAPVVEGNRVFVRCAFITGDAAGQNMVTIATDALVRFVVERSPVVPLSAHVESNASGDKKAAAQTLLSARGKRVIAEVDIPASLVTERLHATPQQLDAFSRIATTGSILSGAIGSQGHVANGLTALFLATGQDAACASEAAVGITRLEATPQGGLYASVTLPNVIVGTVGGGTNLPTQRAALDLLAGGRHLGANALAEIATALCLAGELSIAGAICANEFASAHERLARGRTR